jgi:hypothetical protein
VATTTAGAELTTRHRAQQLLLRTATLRDLLLIWQVFDVNAISKSWTTLEPALVALIQARQPISAHLSARYVTDFRRAEQASGFSITAIAPPLTADEIIPNLRIVGPGNAQRLAALGRRDVTKITFTNVEGEVTRQVLNGGRTTIVNTVHNDPKAHGYYRVTDGAPCAFCAMLAGRGAVYHSDELSSGGFHAHRKCGCTAEPRYSVDSPRTPSAQRWQALYDESAAAVRASNAPDFSAEVRREFRRRYEAMAATGP